MTTETSQLGCQTSSKVAATFADAYGNSYMGYCTPVAIRRQRRLSVSGRVRLAG